MAFSPNAPRNPLPRSKPLALIEKRIAKLRKSRFKKRWIHELNAEERFTWIYKNNYWSNAESVSGPGSTLSQTESIRRELPRIVKSFHVKRLLDAPCGDFNWMQHALRDMDVTYTGGDIVRDLVDDLQRLHGAPGVSFRQLDLVEDPLPEADLLLCRDCLFHLSIRDIARALSNFLVSGIPYLLTTTHIPGDHPVNEDIPTGHFRHIDLFAAPFNLSREPLARFEDWCEPEAPREMCLWSTEQLRAPVQRLLIATSAS